MHLCRDSYLTPTPGEREGGAMPLRSAEATASATARSQTLAGSLAAVISAGKSTEEVSAPSERIRDEIC